MASTPSTGKLTPSEPTRPRADRRGRVAWEREHLAQCRRTFERVLRDCEQLREHCRGQMEMIAAQRELLSALDALRIFAPGVDDDARDAAGADPSAEGETSAGE